MSILVKICGLKTEEAMAAALESGADLVGLVHFAHSPRHVDLTDAARLAAQARGKAETVLVTVDMASDALAAAAEAIRPDWLQFHGHETAEHMAALAARSGCRTIRAVGVAGDDDLRQANDLTDACDMLLLETKPPAGGDRPGGHGITFDWRLVAGRAPDRPWLLSGGLDAGNVTEALTVSGAPGVDVSSGVERARGIKDTGMIRAFIAAARATEHAPDRAASESLAS